MPITRIVTPQFIKDVFLVGIDLTDDDGNEYPEIHYLHAIDSAVSLMEGKYDISLRQSRKFIHREKVDSHWWDTDTWYLTITEKRPLQNVSKFALQFGTYPAAEVPLSWVQIMSPRAGQIQIVPGPEGFRIPYITGGTPLLGFDALGGRGYVPGWVRIEYTAGFEFDLPGTVSASAGDRVITYTPASSDPEDDLIQLLRVGAYVDVAGELHRIDDVLSSTTFRITNFVSTPGGWTSESATVLDYDPALIESVGLYASLPLLDTAGDLIIGAGISNQSISIDGLSQSIGTTSGVENSGYGARVTQYRKRLEDLDHAIRRNYRRMNLAIM